MSISYLNDPPAFSVLVPTHNRCETLSYALRSILLQTCQDFEVIVIGDGCTDGTDAFMRGQTDPRIRWLDLPKAPYFGYANRNRAIEIANGRFLAYCSDDNLLFPDHLETLLYRFVTTDCDVVCSRPLWVDPDCRLLPSFENLSHTPSQVRFANERNEFPLTCFGNKKSCHDTYGGWPEDVSHSADWVMWKNILLPENFEALSFITKPTCLHFRADWRTEDSAGSESLKGIRKLSEHESWPNILRPIAQTEPVLAQKNFIETIEQRPSSSVADWRNAIEQARDLVCNNSVEALSNKITNGPPLSEPLIDSGHCANAFNKVEFDDATLYFGCGFSEPTSNGLRWAGASSLNGIRIAAKDLGVQLAFGVAFIHQDPSALEQVNYDITPGIKEQEPSDIVALNNHFAIVRQFMIETRTSENVQLVFSLATQQKSRAAGLGLAIGPVSLIRSADNAEALELQQDRLKTELCNIGKEDLIQGYLEFNPDVTDAVGKNRGLTGKSHFERHGQFEKRLGGPVWRCRNSVV